jgi:glycosyltransferase involved in cell wall biosynthesis
VGAGSGPRILWLTKGLGRGGVEQLLLGMARHLTDEPFEIDVAYVLPHKRALVDDFAALGLRTISLGEGGHLRWPMRLRRQMQERRYDVVHTHSPVPATAARVVAPSGTAFLHTEHNVWPRLHRLTYWGNVLTHRRNTAVIAVSEAVAATVRPPRFLPWLLSCPVDVVLQGIDASQFRVTPERRAQSRRALGLGDEPVLGTVGNLTAKKDHRTLLAAFAELRHGASSARLLVVGTGPLETDLRANADRLGLGDAVRFLGMRDDVPDVLAALDVFVLSSRHEGLPIALLEALAAGLPCVATTVGGIPEVVRDGHEGYLVPPADPSVMAAALAKILEDPRLRAAMSARAVETAARFDLVQAVQHTTELYRTMVS